MVMARRSYVILIAFSLVASGATPSTAMLSDGHSRMASTGVTMHVTPGGGPESSQPKPETSDLEGSCGNFCLDCGCLNCEARNLAGRTFSGMMAIDLLGTETILLEMRDGNWVITHIHWSSRPAS